MKVSVLSQVIAGASTASAAACSHVNIVPFVSKFEVVTLEDAQAAAADDPGFIEYQASLKLNLGGCDEGIEAGVDAGIHIGDVLDVDISADISLGIRDEQSACPNPSVRVEWRNMKDEDKKSFVDAIGCLMDKPASGLNDVATNRYEELVWAHQKQVSQIHMAGSFLPWHRYYTHLLASLLREECEYSAPFPWWDETKDAGNFTNSGLFTPEYFGSLPTVNEDGHGSCVTDGAFVGKMLHVGPGETDTEHCLSRGEDQDQTKNVSKDYVDTCNSRTEYADMRSCMEFGPHAYGHNGVGPVMAEVSASPGDPAFFMHHSFIDRNWWVWQDKKPGRKDNVTGCATPGEPCTQMTMNTTLSSMGIRPDVTVGDVLDTKNSWLCYTYDY